MIGIVLDETQLRVARGVAKLRQAWAEQHATGNGVSETPAENDIGSHILGATGELGASLILNLAWTGLADHGAHRPDVGGMYEVRAVPPYPQIALRIHKGDKPAPFILARVDLDRGTVDLVGWEHAETCKVPERWCDMWKKNRPAFFVPSDELQPMDALPR